LRIGKILACLALLGLSGCQPAKPKLPTGAEFVDEFHTLCPRTARSADDVQSAFEAAGARRGRPLINLFAQPHAAPAGLPAWTALKRGDVQWRYDGPHWMGLASVDQAAIQGGVETRCKVQLPTGQGEYVDWLVQYASDSMPVAASFEDGARVLVFKDHHSHPDISAYYVLWRGLPPGVWGAKPSVALQYVTLTGEPRPDPLNFQTPPATALARLDQYCADVSPDAVAAKVAAARNGQPDPEYAADDARPGRQAKTWIMRDSDEWRLHTSLVPNPVGQLQQCVVRMVGMHAAPMIDTLVDDPRMALFKDSVSSGKRTLEFRFLEGDRTVLYQINPGPDDPMKSHTLTVFKGAAALRAASEGPYLAIPRAKP
jgi:hypothetical protein